MQVVFAQYLKDHIADQDNIGQLARKVERENIIPGDPRFPNWRDYLDKDKVFADALELTKWQYQTKYPNRNK